MPTFDIAALISNGLRRGTPSNPRSRASGHILPQDLAAFVGAIKPRQVIPVHTTTPQRFKSLFPNTRVLQDGEDYTI